MINRWIGIVAVGLMLIANAALVVRDFLPGWSAGEPPQSRALQLRDGQEFRTQLGIFNQEGRRIGHSWSLCKCDEQLVIVRHRSVFQELPLNLGADIGLLRVDTDLMYGAGARLDNVRVKVLGLGIQVLFEGEYFPPDDFACKWQVGEQRGELVVSSLLTRGLGDAVRPFESLTGLFVGRTWRVEILNPLAGILSDWGARGMTADDMVVTVTGVESVEYMGETVQAFVIEAEALRAWVAPAGRVIRQEFDMPIIGKLIMVEEPYDDALRTEMLYRALRQ